MEKDGTGPSQQWVFGAVCEGCGAPLLHYCPLCGVSLFHIGHGPVPVGNGSPRQLVPVCDDCIDMLNAGDVPPFYPL